jgi:hypothetical protein
MARDLEEAARELVQRTRQAQGLSEQIEDPAVLDQVARVLLRSTQRERAVS